MSKVITKYKDLISKSEAQIQAEDIELSVQEAKSSIEVTIAKTKRDIAQTSKKLKAAQSANPYDLKKEISIYSDLKALEDGLAYAEKVLTERF